jgi:hypothetical protein
MTIELQADRNAALRDLSRYEFDVSDDDAASIREIISKGCRERGRGWDEDMDFNS